MMAVYFVFRCSLRLGLPGGGLLIGCSGLWFFPPGGWWRLCFSYRPYSNTRSNIFDPRSLSCGFFSFFPLSFQWLNIWDFFLGRRGGGRDDSIHRGVVVPLPLPPRLLRRGLPRPMPPLEGHRRHQGPPIPSHRRHSKDGTQDHDGVPSQMDRK